MLGLGQRQLRRSHAGQRVQKQGQCVQRVRLRPAFRPLPNHLRLVPRHFLERGTRPIHLHPEDPAQLRHQLLEELGQAAALLDHGFEHLQSLLLVSRHQAVNEGIDGLDVRQSQHGLHQFQGHGVVAEAHDLIQQADGIPHAALGTLGNHRQGRLLDVTALFLGNGRQMGLDLGGSNPSEVEALAPTDHGRRNPVRLGRGQHEIHVGRRFLQCLEQCVERARAQHVNFVDDEDFDLGLLGRCGLHLVPQFAHILDTVVAGGIDFVEVEIAGVVNRAAGPALAAGPRVLLAPTAEGLGQQTRGAGLASAPGPVEQVGVGDAPGLERVLQRPHDVRLAHKLGETLAPPSAIQCLCHCGCLQS